MYTVHVTDYYECVVKSCNLLDNMMALVFFRQTYPSSANWIQKRCHYTWMPTHVRMWLSARSINWVRFDLINISVPWHYFFLPYDVLMALVDSLSSIFCSNLQHPLLWYTICKSAYHDTRLHFHLSCFLLYHKTNALYAIQVQIIIVVIYNYVICSPFFQHGLVLIPQWISNLVSNTVPCGI